MPALNLETPNFTGNERGEECFNMSMMHHALHKQFRAKESSLGSFGCIPSCTTESYKMTIDLEQEQPREDIDAVLASLGYK